VFFNMYIAIIGGGPVGCFAGYLLGKVGHKVEIYENHPQIGAPIQCTGILTADFAQFKFPMDNFLVNTIDKIEVHAGKKNLVVRQQDYIVCRTKFDNYFADLARQEGAEVFVNHAFIRKEGRCLVIKEGSVEKKIVPDVVIAADGPLSPTAKAYGFYRSSRENYYGIQATVEGKFDKSTIKTYFGDVCPGLFAWITPESGTTARVGLATRKNTKYYFDKFMEENGFKALAIQAGTIPVYNPKQKLLKDNCYLVGDASSYVKATTLGGIVPAFKQVEILVECLNSGKDYSRAIAPVRRQMWLHLQVQRIFNKFSVKDWGRLVDLVNQPKVQAVFEKYTRDNPIPLVLNSVLREPRFLGFAKYLW
jgi:digeranylgeranylglycerophospholipid reductase